jgi:hypothetical protein
MHKSFSKTLKESLKKKEKEAKKAKQLEEANE